MILATTFGALRHRNYRIWFFSQLFSFFGTWMQTAAQGFLLFGLTQSYVWLGYLALASGLPTVAFMMYGGVLCDRYPKRLIIFVAESGMMLISLSLGLLILLGQVHPWQIVLSAFLMGICNAFDIPARQSIVADLTGKQDLPNAVALGAALFNTAVALGPAIGGVIYVSMGPGWCFIINAISFVGVLISLFFMRGLPQPTRSAQRTNAFQAVKAAISLMVQSSTMRTVTLLMCNGVIFGMSLYSLIPAWSVEILHGDSTTNGALLSLRGVGALSAALILATLGRSKLKPHIFVISSFVFPVFLMLFGFSTVQAWSFICLALAGFCQICLFNNANTLTQLTAPQDQRGAVMGVYNFVFNSASPAGGFIASAIAHAIGLVASWEVFAMASFVAAVIIYFSDRQFAKRAM